MFKIFCASVLSLIMASCQSVPKPKSGIQVETYEFTNLPQLNGSNIQLSGFSGLYTIKNGDKTQFITHTDRGPNLEPTENRQRPFLLPEFQPLLVRFEATAGKKLEITDTIGLTYQGRAITGLPNRLDKRGDEIPIDKNGTVLSTDSMGLDLEGLAVDTDGSFWMVDEYRPSVLRFSSKGELLSRWIPKGQSKKFGKSVLPFYYQTRRLNRGFEGVAIDKNAVYAFLQSPLEKDPAGITRILKLDKQTGAILGEFQYPFEQDSQGKPIVDKLGDAASIGDGKFLVIEQNGATNEKAFRRVYKISIDSNTEVKKELVVDLVAQGFGRVEKMEGLAVVDDHTIALVNDNDFALNPSPDRDSRSLLILVRLPKKLY